MCRLLHQLPRHQSQHQHHPRQWLSQVLLKKLLPRYRPSVIVFVAYGFNRSEHFFCSKKLVHWHPHTKLQLHVNLLWPNGCHPVTILWQEEAYIFSSEGKAQLVEIAQIHCCSSRRADNRVEVHQVVAAEDQKTHGFLPLFLAQFLFLVATVGGGYVLITTPGSTWDGVQKVLLWSISGLCDSLERRGYLSQVSLFPGNWIGASLKRWIQQMRS